jgi:hypothetical protein
LEGYNTSQPDYKKNFNLAGYGLQHDSGIVIFHRWDATEVVIVALNFSDRDWVGPVPLGYPGEWIDLQIIGGSGTHGRRIVVDSANLRPVLKLEANWGYIFVKTLAPFSRLRVR